MEWTKRAPSAQRTQHATVGGNPLPNNSRCVLTPTVKLTHYSPALFTQIKGVNQSIQWTTWGREERTRNTRGPWYGLGFGVGQKLFPSSVYVSSFISHFSLRFITSHTMTASAAAAPPATAAPSHLSKTNTDTLCCDPAEGFIRRFVYRVNLWSGAYMLERHERICLYSAVGLFFVSSCLYTVLFASGFVDGWKDSSAAFVLLSD